MNCRGLHLFRLLITVIFFTFCSVASAQGFMNTSGTAIVDRNGKEILLRGMGLGGWMLQEPYMLKLSGIAANQKEIRSKISDLIGPQKTDEFYNAWLKNFCRKADIDSMAAWGFNSVRLPFHYDLFTLPIEKEKVRGENTWLEKGFQMIDSLLAWCEANRMYLILDLHAAPGGQGADIPISDRDPNRPSLWDDEENKRKTVALWRKIAERYKDEEWVGAYDLINEPNWGFRDTADKNGCAENKNGPLRNLLMDITKAIREVDNNHMLIIEGNCWGNNYKGVFPLWDSNTVVSFHKYWNENDQGSVQQFVDLRKELNVPVWMGESGENSNSWFTSAISLLESNKIGWAWWPLKKLGINNPMEIYMNDGYLQLIKYWKGEAPRPSAETAYQALMKQANNTRLENNFIHQEVIDAMFRQVGSTETKPYSRNQIDKHPIVYATNFDMGRLGDAYYSLDSGNYRVSRKENIQWNKGWRYRNEAVDIDTSSRRYSNGFKISRMQPGEWLSYTVQTNEEGIYDMEIFFSAEKQFRFSVEANGQISNFEAPGGNNLQTSVVAKQLGLKKGSNRIIIKAGEGDISVTSFKFSRNRENNNGSK